MGAPATRTCLRTPRADDEAATLGLRLFVLVKRIEHSARHWRWRRAIGSARTYTTQFNIRYFNHLTYRINNKSLPARCGLGGGGFCKGGDVGRSRWSRAQIRSITVFKRIERTGRAIAASCAKNKSSLWTSASSSKFEMSSFWMRLALLIASACLRWKRASSFFVRDSIWRSFPASGCSSASWTRTSFANKQCS